MHDVFAIGGIVLAIAVLMRARPGGRAAVIEHVVGLVLAIGLLVYLLVALLRPERF